MTTGIDDLQVIVPYCERLATGGEPVNTLSNLGFILAALYGWHLWRASRRNQHSYQAGQDDQSGHSSKNTAPGAAVMLLLLLCLCIAAGSALFHAKPNHLTHLLDIVPVCLFALLAVWVCLKSYAWPRSRLLGLLIIWITATALAAQWPQVLAHSLFYLPTLLVLIYLAFALKQQRKRLLLLALAFGSALLFRALDLPLCALKQSEQAIAGEVGTHFMWHLLTAVACVLCLQLLLVSRSSKPHD